GHGNCGGWNSDNDLIVAISKRLYDSGGASNCGQASIRIIDTDNGRSAYGKVVDSCQSCGDNDLDISPALFSQFDNPGKGVLSVSWHFMPKGWSP
ncbi:RlpA-like double-psi beta-barrel-protein domain-containing protein-containing protein, partial [Cyathus striatus]